MACLQAPEPAEVPRSLLRADGRSIYQRHGGVRYATHAQLSLEEGMLALARGGGAPRMTRADAARALGADLAQLEAALAGRAHDAQDAPSRRTRTGLREDQAAASLAVLTDGRRVSVINAPAAAGRAWAAAGLGRVIGITPSQSARNTLAAGVPVSYNTAQFLSHLPGQRRARGPVRLRPGDLVLMDEASMVSNPDLADVVAQAAAAGAKVILAGDTQQLQAVNGGGMSLLADALGYVQLAEPVRFRAAWEQAGSLRLREGDSSVLAEYDQRGRIYGGEPEQMMDAAAAAYLALTLDGVDTLLMAADHALRRELSRRVREDLIRFGIVQPGPAVRIADGATASPGDLIICTRNDHTAEAGEPGRTLANGDLLRIDAVTRDGLIVRRALDADPRTGQRRWTGQHFLYRNYGTAERGYAVTDHVAQGRTVTAGLAVITGTEDRQHALVALTRGTDANLAYVFTTSPKRADPVPGPRPAPELTRYDQAEAERIGPSALATPSAPAGEALAVLSAVLERDGQLLSASQDRYRALASADHLAVLNAIWTAETAPARQQRYQDLFAASLPSGYRREPGHQAKWLWRTMRAAELAGLDAGQILAAAIGERDLAGSRDLAAVIDARLRHRTRFGRPAPSRPVVRAGPRHRRPRTPRLRGRDRRADGRAQGPDRRARRRQRPALGGEHPGPGPGPPAGPAGLAAPRTPPSAPGGNYPATTTPPTRSAPSPSRPPRTCGRPGTRPWPPSGPPTAPTCAACRTAMLLHLRDTYPLETAWAPQHVGDELRQVRAAAWDARLAAVRAAAEAEAAQRRGQPEQAARQQALAASYRAIRDAYAEREVTFAAVMADRADWDAATRHQRHLAVAADAELRRRHPARHYPPLRSAEPPPATQAQRAELTPAAGQQIPETGQWIKDLAAQRHKFADRLADRQSLMIPPRIPTTATSARPSRPGQHQPGTPSCNRPSPRSSHQNGSWRALERDLDREAAD